MSLKEKYRWPEKKPNLEKNAQGWFTKEAAQILGKYLNEETKIVVELGSWFGKSTRHILEAAPNALVIAVDHWKGSKEHNERIDTEKLKKLYGTFLVNCWDYQDRLIPLKTYTQKGLEEIAEEGLVPDLIYIDAAHDYKSVMADIQKSVALFPTSQIVGDDWNWGKGKPVRKAVLECANLYGFEMGILNNTWEYIKL